MHLPLYLMEISLSSVINELQTTHFPRRGGHKKKHKKWKWKNTIKTNQIHTCSVRPYKLQIQNLKNVSESGILAIPTSSEDVMTKWNKNEKFSHIFSRKFSFLKERRVLYFIFWTVCKDEQWTNERHDDLRLDSIKSIIF